MSGTRQKTLGEQLSQTLMTEGRGEALDAEAEDAEPLMAKPAPENPALAEQLMEEVCDRGNLERAWKRVRSNKGSPGVDGMTVTLRPSGGGSGATLRRRGLQRRGRSRSRKVFRPSQSRQPDGARRRASVR